MISIVLYGRNDSYGYNLHKRAALSLNCMSEVLSGEQDEILFVDYNTPDDFPTFPEAIQDTLTPRARKLLRILRVRPHMHERFRTRTHLVAPEPIARNVAIRRSNPQNRWILSTNTDMIFVPRDGRSLTEIVDGLPDGYYQLPRFEIPESLWETLDRTDPAATIRKVGEWGERFHLNEIIHAADPAVKFDAPGDFQLMLRSDLFKIGGFHEDMLLGWHLDSNIAKRLFLLYGRADDLTRDVFGYHCDHTRQVTPAHRPGSVQNDLATFVDNVSSPSLPAQAETWGMPDTEVEDLTVEATSRSYSTGILSAIGGSMSQPTEFEYKSATYDRVNYTPEHLLPFLLDIFASYPRTTRLGWFGSRADLLSAFANGWRAMGFVEPIRVAEGATWLGTDLPDAARWSRETEIDHTCGVFVFDWGLPTAADAAPQDLKSSATMQFVGRAFNHMVWSEQRRQQQGRELPRRFVGVNAIHNRFENLVGSFIGAARTPMTTRIRQGFLLPPQPPRRDLLPRLSLGEGSERRDGGIALASGGPGHALYGPYLSLQPSLYELNLTFQVTALPPMGDASCPILLEVYAAPYTLLLRAIRPAELRAGTTTCRFYLSQQLSDLDPWGAFELRLAVDHNVQVILTAVTLERLDGSGDLAVSDWLPLMRRGGTFNRVKRLFFRLFHGRPASAAASRFLSEIVVARAERGHVAYGPYVVVPPGRYQATFALDFDGLNSGRRHTSPIALDIATDGGETVLAHARPAVTSGGAFEYCLDFEVPERLDKAADVEARIWSDGTTTFRVVAVRVALAPVSDETVGTT